MHVCAPLSAGYRSCGGCGAGVLHDPLGEAGAGEPGGQQARVPLHDRTQQMPWPSPPQGHTDRILKPYDTYGVIDDDDAEERSQIEAKLWTAIDSLPEKCRQVFLMSKRDGLKYEEIAEELGLSVNTVRNQISKALNVLKNGAIKIYSFILGIF